MFRTRVLLQHRQPLIKFLGKRTPAASKVDHTPQPHPESPKHELPDSFANYRKKAQQHGPLGGSEASSDHATRSGASLGPVDPPRGEFFDRDELPTRFHRTLFSPEEIDAIDSGGASKW